jgi:hypothetical protein
MICDCRDGKCDCPDCVYWRAVSFGGASPFCRRCGGTGVAHCCDGDVAEARTFDHTAAKTNFPGGDSGKPKNAAD